MTTTQQPITRAELLDLIEAYADAAAAEVQEIAKGWNTSPDAIAATITAREEAHRAILDATANLQCGKEIHA